MKIDILKYIQNEKDISRYHISTIERSKNISSYKRRILNIEREFLDLPLEDMYFEDVADVAAAISIYRTSRSLFYSTYKIKPPGLEIIDKVKYLQHLNAKFNFIKKTGIHYMYIKVQEINSVQDQVFYLDLANKQSLKNKTSLDYEKKKLDNMDLKALLKIEPSIVARKRARVQTLIYSIGKYLIESINDISIVDEYNLELLQEIEKKLDDIVSKISVNIFQYYNDGLITLASQLNGTLGENCYFKRLPNLQNVLDFSNFKKFAVEPKPISNPQNFSCKEPVLGNVLFGAKKAIVNSLARDTERKIKNKVFGILLPIPRKGNEKMTLLYKKIMIDNIDISHLFSSGISNIKALKGNNEIYFKAILMDPLWKIINMSSSDNVSRYMLAKLVNFDENNYPSINFDNREFINQINKNHLNFFKINKDSIVLTPRTRSEEEGLLEIMPLIEARISEIINDYAKLSFTTNELILD